MARKMVYKAYYNWQFVWIPAGEAEFNIKENKDTYEITVVGKTYRSYDAFLGLETIFTALLIKNDVSPIFVRIVEEGKYRKFDSLIFRQDQLTAISLITDVTGKRLNVKPLSYISVP
ncbi:MAG: DUF3108 domain-containing protein [Saprospiraceae bacterium]|nr:DUF3108 domain-containing protein [Saprospiraceae bacterium]